MPVNYDLTVTRSVGLQVLDRPNADGANRSKLQKTDIDASQEKVFTVEPAVTLSEEYWVSRVEQLNKISDTIQFYNRTANKRHKKEGFVAFLVGTLKNNDVDQAAIVFVYGVKAVAGYSPKILAPLVEATKNYIDLHPGKKAGSLARKALRQISAGR
jgi:hypothetical protein